MSENTKLSDAIGRVTKYLDELAKTRRGIDQEEIHGLHRGDEREAILMASDIRIILAASRATDAPAQGDATPYAAALLEDIEWCLEQASHGWRTTRPLENAHRFIRESLATQGEQVQVPSGELPPFPEMDRLPDIAHAQNTHSDWDDDYRDTWQMLQVETRNKMQWRGYAIRLRNMLAGTPAAVSAPQGQADPVGSDFVLVPREPTGVMKDCGASALPLSAANTWTAADCYRAMIRAAAQSAERGRNGA